MGSTKSRLVAAVKLDKKLALEDKTPGLATVAMATPPPWLAVRGFFDESSKSLDFRARSSKMRCASSYASPTKL